MAATTAKLLTATTALVAASSSMSFALDTVSTVTTTTVHVSNTSAGTLTINANISTNGAAAVDISRTGAVIINNNATLRAQNTSATIQLMNDTGVTGVTINNSGTIIHPNDLAIVVDEDNAAGNPVGATINNHGSITGKVVVGDGGLTYNGLNATQTGDIHAKDGTNTLTLTNSRLIGNYTGGTGNDTVTLTNSTVSGTLEAGTGTNKITLDGDKTFTLEKGSLIKGFQTVDVKTNTVVNDGITGAAAINVSANRQLTLNTNLSMANAGVLNNNGYVAIQDGKTLQVDDYVAGANSSLGFQINDENNAGLLKFRSGSNHGLGATSATISVGANSGYIVSGSRVTIVEGDAASTNLHLLNTSTGVYRFATEASGNDVELVIGRVSTSDVVKGNTAKIVAGIMDTVSSSATGELLAVQSAIGQAQTAGGVQKVVDSLTPAIDGAGTASIGVAVETGNQVSNRLASLRQGYGTGVATGDPLSSSHMWVQGLGSTSKQDDKDGHYGYDAKSGGVSAGMDTDTLINGVTTGIAATYAKSKVDSNSTSGASTDIDTYAATIYASRVFDSGFFLNGQLGAGFNQYDMSRNVVGVGTAKGDTDGWQGTAKIEAGRDLAMGAITVTPLASVQYTYLDMDKYTETGVGNAGLTVTPDAMSTIDAALGLKLAYAIALADGGSLIPSVHAKYIHRMGDRELASTSSFLGASGTAFNTTGVEGDDASINLGAGLLLTTVGGTDLSLNYDADIRDSLTGHTGQVKARWAF